MFLLVIWNWPFCFFVTRNSFIGLYACRFTANDGKMKLKAMFPSSFSSEINSGNIQNLGFIQVFDYTLNDIPSKQEK